MPRRRLSSAEGWKEAYVLLPALLGAFTFGGMIGVWVDVNPYYPAFVAAWAWGLGAVAIVAVETRPTRREPWEVLAAARSVTDLQCECTNPKRDEYTGRDGCQHCAQCDGWLPNGYCIPCGGRCRDESPEGSA